MEELKIKIFGPGFGEGIVVGIGQNFWFTIDSCLEQGNVANPLIRYLERNAVNLTTDLKFVVATHWHDDHIKGISQIFDRGDNAIFVSSTLITEDWFEKLVHYMKTTGRVTNSGVRELGALADSLKRRQYSAVRWASHGQTIFRNKIPIGDRFFDVELTCFSPTADAVQRELSSIFDQFPIAGSFAKRLSSHDKNNASVTMVLTVNGFSILFGADLEVSPTGDLGWLSVLDDKNVPPPKASIFKIPHHGSSGADHPRIWDELLHPNPLCLFTPYNKLKNPIPTAQDIERILGRSDRAFLTSVPKIRELDGLDPSVARTLRERGVALTYLQPQYGSVEITVPLADLSLENAKIGLSDTARRITQNTNP